MNERYVLHIAYRVTKTLASIMPESVVYRLWRWIHIENRWCEEGPWTFTRTLAQNTCENLEWSGWKREPLP